MAHEENGWVEDVVQRETGGTVHGAHVVYDRAGLTVAVAETRQGPVVAVRTPEGDGVVTVRRAPRPAGRALDELAILEPYRRELAEVGVAVPAALASADPHVLARATGAPVAIVKRWQSAAELLRLDTLGGRDAAVLAFTGVDGLTDLARRSPSALAEEIARRLEMESPGAVPYDVTTVGRWIEEARAVLRDARALV